MADETRDSLGRTSPDFQQVIDELLKAQTKGTVARPEREQELKILQDLAEQMKSLGNFGADIEEVSKAFDEIAKDLVKSAKERKNLKSSPSEVSKRIQEAQKIDSRLNSVKKMASYLKAQKTWHDAQMGVLNGILDCCLKGSALSAPSTVTETVESKSSSSRGGESDGGRGLFDSGRFAENLKRQFETNKFDWRGLFGSGEIGSFSSTLKRILVGDPSITKAFGNLVYNMQKELFDFGSYDSVLGKITEGIFKSQKDYEQNIRRALYETAGATKESEKLFKVMSDIGNTVEITGVKQEESLKAIVKLSRMGIKYDGDSERYKKRILSLTTTTLNTEKQLGMEAGSLNESFTDLYRYGVLNENSIANLGRGMREVARTTGISGEEFKKVLSTTQGIVDAMRKASTLTASSAKNIMELGAGAQKYGVGEEIANISKAAGSTVNLFKEASDGTRLLLMNAANAAGRLGDLQAGTLLRSKQGIKDLAQGVNQVFRQFGIESAEAIDNLSDESKMRLNLVLSSAFNLELGQVKGILKTLDQAGKTFADKMIDLDTQLAKNLSFEKKTALLEEQRKLKIEKNLDLLGILSEAAENSKTMTDAFSKFGKRREEFESDLKALGLGGSNKDVIREAINQSLTSVNAALSKSGLKEISFSAEEMAKALEDPQAFQDLLGKLTTAEQKTAASGNAQLDAISKTNNAIDNLSAIVQNQIAKPLNFLLSSGGITGVIASNLAISLGPSIASSMSGVLGRLFAKSATTSTSADVGSGGGGGGGGGGGSTGKFLEGLKTSFSGSGEALGNWAKSWMKFAGNLAIAGALVYGGYLLLSQMKPISVEEFQELALKVGALGMVAGLGAALMGEIYLASLVLDKVGSIQINWKNFAIGAAALAVAALVLPPFIVGLSEIAGFWTSKMDIGSIVSTTSGIADLMIEGAKLIAALAAGTAILAGIGFLAALPGAIPAIGIGAAALAAAALVLPPFIVGLSEIVGFMTSTINPNRIKNALEKLIGIMEPAAKLISYIGLISAAIAGAGVAGIASGIVGGIAYGIGAIGSWLTGGPNLGNVNEAIKATLEKAFSIINTMVDNINIQIGTLTPAAVLASLNKLQSFETVGSALTSTISGFGMWSGESLFAYLRFTKVSTRLAGIQNKSPDEIADQFRGVANVLKGIAIIGDELEKSGVNLAIGQSSSLKSFLKVVSESAIPIFNALAAIEKVTQSEGFKDLSTSAATFNRASKILEDVSPYLRSIMYNMQFVTKILYEGLGNTPIEQLKIGGEVSSQIIEVFSNFVGTVKNIGKNLSPKDMEEFEKIFGNPKTINSLRNVLANTSSIVDVFGKESRSSLDLKYIAANMKNYGEFYSSVGTLLKSYSDIQKTVDPKDVQNIKDFKGAAYGGRVYEITTSKDLASNFDVAAAGRLERNLTGAFNLINSFIHVATDPNNISNLSSVAEASANLNDLGEASKSMGEFLSAFDVNTLSKLDSFSQSLQNLTYIKTELGDKKVKFQAFTALGMMIGDTARALNIVFSEFSKISQTINPETINSFSKQMYNISGSINSLIESATKISDPAAITRLQSFISALPKEKPVDLEQKLNNLKAYLDGIAKMVEPDFAKSIFSLNKIKGISIESNAESAIKLVSSLSSFIVNIQTEFGKINIRQSAKDAQAFGQYATNKAQSPISEDNLKNIKDFIENQALPAIGKIEDIAIKLAKMPVNDAIVENASKKLESFGRVSNSLGNFFTGLSTFQRTWTTKNISSKYAYYSPSDTARKQFRAFAKTDEELTSYLKDLQKQFGYNKEHWKETAFKESDLDVMTRMFDEKSAEGKDTAKLFDTLSKIPKFYGDKILAPFMEGGGGALSLGGINFVSQALEGISKIIVNFLGNDGVLRTLQKNSTKITARPGSISELEKATNILTSLSQNNVFSDFVGSLLDGVIFPILIASRLVGGPTNLTNGIKATEAFSTIIKIIPDLLKNVTVELSKIGDIQDASSVISNAKVQIDKLKEPLPKLLQSLTENIILPVLENLLPAIYVEQALKRLKASNEIVQNLNEFIGTFAAIDNSLSGTFNQLGIVESIGNLLNAIDPVDGNLSSFSDKLITIKESLETIANTMNSIIGMTVGGSVLDVLNKIGEIPASGINAINNVGTNLAKVNLDNFENIKNKLQLEVIPNKNSPENESLEKLNEKEEKNLEKQDQMLKVLSNIHSALVSAGVMPEGSSYTISQTGKLGVNKSTGNGTASSGNVLASSSVSANNLNPTIGIS